MNVIKIFRAFTLLELVVVLIVVGILVSAGVYVYQSVQNNSKDQVTVTNARQWAWSVGGTTTAETFPVDEQSYNSSAQEAIGSFHKLGNAGELLIHPQASSEAPWQIAVRYLATTLEAGPTVVLSSALRSPDTRHCVQTVSDSYGRVLALNLNKDPEVTAVGNCVPADGVLFQNIATVSATDSSWVTVPGYPPDTVPQDPPPDLPPPSSTISVSNTSVPPWNYLKISGTTTATPSNLVYLFIKRPGSDTYTYVMWSSLPSGEYLFDHINGGTILTTPGVYTVLVAATADITTARITYDYTYTG